MRRSMLTSAAPKPWVGTPGEATGSYGSDFWVSHTARANPEEGNLTKIRMRFKQASHVNPTRCIFYTGYVSSGLFYPTQKSGSYNTSDEDIDQTFELNNPLFIDNNHLLAVWFQDFITLGTVDQPGSTSYVANNSVAGEPGTSGFVSVMAFNDIAPALTGYV